MAEVDLKKNKKLFALSKDVYDLLMQIYRDEHEAEERFMRLSRSKKELATSLKEQRAHSNESDRPLYLYKSIMCPLKDKCPDATGPRWPNSNINTISQMGRKCPYAHHYSELHFKYAVRNA